MKTAKPPSQIKRFVRLFASHAPKITPASFFRHTLSPKTIVTTLLGEEVLRKIRQELDRQGRARLELKAVFHAVVQVLNPEAAVAAANLTAPVKKKKHRQHRKPSENEQPEADASTEPIQAQPPPAAGDETPT
jgi:hypothetical protein